MGATGSADAKCGNIGMYANGDGACSLFNGPYGPKTCTTSSGSSSSGSGATACNSGPGTCTNPQSANNCRNGSVCERPCTTCSYACFVPCSTDSQCAGACDSSGNPLICSTCPLGVCNAGFSACDIKR